ncbi:spondin domain-containing protein [Aliiglaciecola sp. CAU 1673]|uniref:spondin domain-containing protein n=1 Tax=Aliiglaciecola sp. CAU 1673 TaxID=3032595 RepID=UPI0023DA5051|nr:spondin domain-containing protein [Aliiglaciecola sp. CAU 1673]MDF2177786.1 spondin domain-containing protein [Aliiglaciecola sp. CAU 1673]
MKSYLSCTAGLAMLMAAPVYSAQLSIQVQNLTQGIYFTPLLITAHTPDISLFNSGEAASSELQAMAEGGDISALVSLASGLNANNLENPAGGLLAPGQSASGSLATDDANSRLSLVGMILPSNDGFVGLNSWTIPTEPGTYSVYLNAYDAGTEVNDEIRGGGAPGEAGMPVPPPLEALVGTGGTGVASSESNSTVHIHRGNLGDDNLSGGSSDIQNQVQRWLNPVAKVTIVVN